MSPALAAIFAAELERTAPDALVCVVDEVQRRHGDCVAAVLFYGSCLRTGRYDDGVLDVYVIVDSYRAAYDSKLLAFANAVLPPNVFYIEVLGDGAPRAKARSGSVPHGATPERDVSDGSAAAGVTRKDRERRVRCKYAVISGDGFARGCRAGAVQSIIWARFCQPAVLAYGRDAEARRAVIRSTAEASLTMLLRVVALHPDGPIRCEDLWLRGLTETYRAELRVETPETIRQIYAHAPERYDRLAIEALRELERRRYLRLDDGQGTVQGTINVAMNPRCRRVIRRRWMLRRALGKPLAAARLLKSMATFGDWLPYALWKLQRHTGVGIEPTEWQRRHVLLACWPVILRLLMRRTLR